MKTIYLLIQSFFRNIIFFNTRHKKDVPAKNKFTEKSHNPIVHFLTYNFLKDRISLILPCLFFSSVSFAQNNPEYTRSYLNNVVEIGLSDFGLITGEDSTHIYFVAVRRSLIEKDAFPEKIANTIKQVKFYGNSYKAKATKVIDTRVGAFTVVLYKSPKPPSSLWQRNFYNSMAYKKGKLSTFRDKWLSDKIWAVQEAKISVIKQSKVGVVTLRVPKDAGIAKGMPLVNSDGFIGGIFAESSLGKTVVHVINMKEIANALYAAARNKCRYFNMVEWGKSDIRCVLEENARLAAIEKAKLDAEAKLAGGKKAKKPGETKDTSEVNTVSTKKREKKTHFLDDGINANILTNPVMDDKTNGKDNFLKTRAFHVGFITAS